MNRKLSWIGLLIVALTFGCDRSSNDIVSVNHSNQKAVPAATSPNSNSGVAVSNVNANVPKSSLIPTPSVVQKDLSKEDTTQVIRESLGEISVATDFQPDNVAGDFNGDGISDRAFVVKSLDNLGWNEILPRLTSKLNIKNMANGFVVNALPQNDSATFQKNNARLASKDKYALLIINGKSADINAAISDNDTGNKFLLLNSLFPAEFEETTSKPDLLSLVKKGDSCLPKKARGEGLFSGDMESAGKVIYFDGRNYLWTQCGD